MITFDFSDFEKLAKSLDNVERQMPFVLSYALNNAMKDAKAAEEKKMREVFDRPTTYTMTAIKIDWSSKTNLRATLRFKDQSFKGTPADKFLAPEVYGGARHQKATERQLIRNGFMKPGEFIVPGQGVKLDAHGNIRGNVFTEILSGLGIATDAHQNRTKASKKRNKKLKPFFVLRGTKAANGVYMRKGRKAVPILIFVRSPSYKPRYPFYDVGRQVLRPAMQRHFDYAVEHYIIKDTKRRA